MEEKKLQVMSNPTRQYYIDLLKATEEPMQVPICLSQQEMQEIYESRVTPQD